MIAQVPGNPEAAEQLESWMPLGLMAVLLAAVVALFFVVGWRQRRSPLLAVPAGMERIGGIPGWAGVMVGLAVWSLFCAGIGFFADVAWHVGRGRDEELFTAPHTMIVIGLAGIALSGVLGIITATLTRAPVGFRFRNLTVPWSAVPMLLLGSFALIGFPLDELWHAAYGVDVTMWSPTHLLMIVGAVLSLVAGWLALAEAGVPVRESLWSRLCYFGAGFLVLAGLAALLGEFRFGVPQFQQLYHPVLLAILSTFAFVAARLALGPGWAVAMAVAVWLPEVIGLADIANLGDGEQFVPTRSPGLYLVSAAAVEVAAVAVGTARRLRFAVVAGLAVATIGLAGEYLWNRDAIQPWRAVLLLPDGVLVGAIGAVGAGVLAAAYARAAGRLGGPGLPRWAGVAGAAAVVLSLALPLPRRAPDGITAAIDVTDRGDGTADVEVVLDPADAADDARWFQVLSWQGNGARAVELDELGSGRFRAEEPVPISGSWKSLVRLHVGDAMLGAPIFLPEDREIDAPLVPAEDRTVELGPEQDLLLREAREGPATTAAVAYTVIGLVAMAWATAFAVAVRRIAAMGPIRTPPTETVAVTVPEPGRHQPSPILDAMSGARRHLLRRE